MRRTKEQKLSLKGDDNEIIHTHQAFLDYYLSPEVMDAVITGNLYHTTALAHGLTYQDIYDIHIDIYVKLSKAKSYKPKTKKECRNYFFRCYSNYFRDVYNGVIRNSLVTLRNDTSELKDIIVEEESVEQINEMQIVIDALLERLQHPPTVAGVLAMATYDMQQSTQTQETAQQYIVSVMTGVEVDRPDLTDKRLTRWREAFETFMTKNKDRIHADASLLDLVSLYHSPYSIS